MLTREQYRALTRALITSCTQFEDGIKKATGLYREYLREQLAEVEAALALVQAMPLDLADGEATRAAERSAA
jgi:hypothetical protein